jgi:hypothetical protein
MLKTVEVDIVVNDNTDTPTSLVHVGVIIGEPGQRDEISGKSRNKEGIWEKKEFAGGLSYNGGPLSNCSKV